MRLYRNITLFFIFLALIIMALPAISARQEMDARTAKAYGKLPLSFVENKGQLDKQVRYVIRGSQASAFFTNNGVTFDLTQSQKGKSKSPHDINHAADAKQTTIKHVALRMEFRDASSKCTVTGMDKLPGKVNMFIGKDSAKWKKGINTYKGVIYKNVWKRIDVAYRGDKRELKYDILVSPGAKVSQIKLKYSGAQRLSLDNKGDLHIQTAVASFIERVPGVHQMKSGKKIALKGAYTLIDKQTVGFKVQGVDPALPLVIDPVSDLKYSTYLGSPGSEGCVAISVDDYGCAYIGGCTDSSDFPTTTGAYDVTFNNYPGYANWNIFISKLNAHGTSLEYSTYIGGTNSNVLGDIAVDEYGYLYLTGWAWMQDFPSTPGSMNISCKYSTGEFIGKLCPLGDNFEYLASFGGSSYFDSPYGIAIDPEGCAYITGSVSSTDFPVTSGAYQSTNHGLTDCFVTKINPTGTMLIYSTFLGGSSDEGYRSKIAVNKEGYAYVSGYTKSTDFPTTSGSYDETYNGGTLDGYIVKLNQSGTGLEFSTFLGGISDDVIRDITLDNNDNVYVVGTTKSSDFPVTPGVYDETYCDYEDGFIAKLNPTGSSLALSTIFGDIGGIYPSAIARDTDGYIYVSGLYGYTATPDAFCKESYRAVLDGYTYNMGFISKFDPLLTKLVYSTYFGGGEYQDLTDMAIDNNDSIYITGQTYSDGLSVTPGAFDTTFNGGTNSDAFVAKFDIKHASVKPDVWIRPITNPAYTGMNVYEDVPSTQVCSQTVKVNKTAVYYAWIENDSKISGFIGVRGTGLPSGWTLKYTDADGADITSDMLAGLYLTKELAPGKKQLIVISITPLAGAAGDDGVTLTASSVGTSFMKDSARFNAVFDPAKPDIWLRPSTASTYIGMNVYESTPAAQIASQVSTANKTLVYYARIENDGPISGKFTIKSNDAPAGWSVKYLDSGSVDITSGVIAGTFETANLAPGANTLITVYLKSLSGAPAANINIDLTATNAASPVNIDSCRFSVQNQPGKPDMWIRALPDASYIGMDVYEASPVTQICSQTAVVNKTSIYYAWIENDGLVSAKFAVTGTALPTGWDLKYRDAGGIDITSSVLAGTYQTADLAPGKRQLVVIYIKPLTSGLGNSSVTLTASSQGGVVSVDSGLFNVKGQ